MKTIDKPILKELRDRIDAALAQIGKEFDCSLSLGNCSYTDTNATFKLKVAVKDGNGTTINPYAAYFLKAAKYYGVEPSDLGKTVRLHDGEYVLTGINSKARRFPFVGKRVSDGKSFKLTETSVQNALAALKGK